MLPRNKKLKFTAAILRKNMTKQEKHLWYDYLAKHTVKFYRQKIIGNYIADFYCDKAKLVVELDGAQHYEKDAREYDGLRTEYFDSLGIKVLRFSNEECDRDFGRVCGIIDSYVKVKVE